MTASSEGGLCPPQLIAGGAGPAQGPDTKTASAQPRALPWLTRAEYLAVAVAAGALLLLHAREVSWPRAAAAFALVDVIGYLPGARAFRRSGGRPIARVYHHLYNVTHNFLTLGAAIALWALARGGLEWAMLALPLHLAGDRGLFGNGWKPADRTFERTSVARHAEAAP